MVMAMQKRRLMKEGKVILKIPGKNTRHAKSDGAEPQTFKFKYLHVAVLQKITRC
jgi:hypothetical protein